MKAAPAVAASSLTSGQAAVQAAWRAQQAAIAAEATWAQTRATAKTQLQAKAKSQAAAFALREEAALGLLRRAKEARLEEKVRKDISPMHRGQEAVQAAWRASMGK